MAEDIFIPDPWADGKTPAEGDDTGDWSPPEERVVEDGAGDFEELLSKSDKTPHEKALCQAITQLSTHPAYEHLSMDAVYDRVVEQAKEVGY